MSYRAFQRNGGNSAKVRAAGTFVGTGANKLNVGGGEPIELGTRQTCLSRFYHVDGNLHGKSRSLEYGMGRRCAFLAGLITVSTRSKVAKVTRGKRSRRAASDAFEPAFQG